MPASDEDADQRAPNHGPVEEAGAAVQPMDPSPI